MCEHDGSDGKLHIADDVNVPAALKRTSVHCGEVTQAKLDLDHEQGDVELRGDDEEGTQGSHQSQDLVWWMTHLVAHIENNDTFTELELSRAHTPHAASASICQPQARELKQHLHSTHMCLSMTF